MERRAERTEVDARNYRLVQADSMFVGLVSVSGTFLPVLLVRLGATGTAIGLLTALPACVAFIFAVPYGRWLQRRRNIVAWYSGTRLIAWLSYGTMAAAAALLPPEEAVPTILVVWAAASLPSVAGLVAFPIVMDGAAGPDGRFDLLGRRWAIAGAATSVGVALAGQALGLIPFPDNFEWLLVGCSAAGVASFSCSRRIVIPDQVLLGAPTGDGATVRLRAFIGLIRQHPMFLDYELRAFVLNIGIGLAIPLLPLLYVSEIRASDGWIGVIGAAQSAGAVAGYLVARRTSRRRGANAILLPSMLIVALVPAMLSVLHDLLPVVVLSVVAGVAAAGMQLALFNELMNRVPRAHGVTFTSVDASLQNLGLIVGPGSGGILAATIGVRTGLIVAASVALIAFGLFALDWRSARRSRLDGARARGTPSA
jgi:hypothetical protein